MEYLLLSDFDYKGLDKIVNIFKKLGYQTCCEQLNIEDLEFPQNLEPVFSTSYLIANQDDSEFQVILFEILPKFWDIRRQIVTKVMNQLRQRPTKFLTLFTLNYQQLLLSSTISKFNERFELQFSTSIAEISLSNSTIAEIRLLEQLALKNTSYQELASNQSSILDFYSVSRRYEKKDNCIQDNIGWYLKQIGRVPLLTHEQEIVYGKQVQKMMPLIEQRNHLCETLGQEPNLVEWTEAAQLKPEELNRILQLGNCAKQKMIEANLRLVVRIAKKYQKRNIDFLDLIQEGNLGLIRAVEKFDYRMGYKLSTYAYRWIRQSITRAIAEKSRTIRLPIRITEKLNKIKKVQWQLSQVKERSVTIQELAWFIEITPNQIREYLEWARHPLSLNIKVGDNQDTELGELLEDAGPQPEDFAIHASLKLDLDKLMENLSPQQLEVISLHFGLSDGQPLSLAKIGALLNISQNQVRQIQAKAFTNLRNSNYKDILYSYLYIDKESLIKNNLTSERKIVISQILNQWKEYIKLSKIKVREILLNNPQISNQEVASLCRISEEFVVDIRKLLAPVHKVNLSNNHPNKLTEINVIIQKVREILSSNPQLSNQEIASLCHVAEGYVFDIRQFVNKEIKNKITTRSSIDMVQQRVKEILLNNPQLSNQEIASLCHVAEGYVFDIRQFINKEIKNKITNKNRIRQVVKETLLNAPQLSNQEVALLCRVSEEFVVDIRQFVNEYKSKIKNKILILPKWSDLEIAISCDVSESDVSNIRKYLYLTDDKVENLQCIQSTTINNLRSVYIYVLEYERKSIMGILKSIRKLEKNMTKKYNINEEIIDEIKKEEKSLMQIINKILMRLNVQN